MSATLTSTPFVGAKLQSVQARRSVNINRTVMAVTKKVNSYDDAWTKGFFTSGMFLEDQEKSGPSTWKKIENKKLLSSVEKLGLLSKAESAGLSLSKIEELGLLSTAERLGLLTIAEEALTSEPGAIAALSLPFIVASVGALTLIPHDNPVTSVLSYAIALTAAGVASAFFVGGFVVAAIQEE